MPRWLTKGDEPELARLAVANGRLHSLCRQPVHWLLSLCKNATVRVQRPLPGAGTNNHSDTFGGPPSGTFCGRGMP